MAGEPVSAGAEREAVLLFRIESSDRPDAAFVGVSLLRTGDALARPCSTGTRSRRDEPARRAPRWCRVGLGDLVAVGGALDTSYQHRELLAGFLSHLRDAIEIIANLSGQDVPKETRLLVKEAAGAVADGRAKNVTFNNSGTINRDVIIINNVNAPDLAEHPAPRLRPPAARVATVVTTSAPLELSR